MDLRSRGFSHSTSYVLEGETARIIGHYSREQTQAAIAPHTAYSLPFFGHGGGIEIDVRVHALRPGRFLTARARGTAPPMVPSERADTAVLREGAPLFTRRVMTSPMILVDGQEQPGGGIFDPFGDLTPQPPTFPIDPPIPPGGGGGGGSTHAAVRVELFAPGIDQPVQTTELPEEVAGTFRTIKFNPQGVPTPDAPVRRRGWWRVVMTPTGPEPVMPYVAARAMMERKALRATSISARLFDHVFRVALEALVPYAAIEGKMLKVSIGPEIAREFNTTPLIHEQDISPIISRAKLTSLKITAVAGREVKKAAQLHHRHPIGIDLVKDDDIAVRIQAGFQHASASAFGVDLAKLDGQFGELYLVFNRNLTELTPAAFIAVDFSTLADWAISIASLFTEVNHDIVNTKIEEALRHPDHSRMIRTYLREVLSRALGQRAVLHDVVFANNGWRFQHFEDAVLPAFDPNRRPDLFDHVFAGAGTAAGASVSAGAGPGSGTGAGSGAGAGPGSAAAGGVGAAASAGAATDSALSAASGGAPAGSTTPPASPEPTPPLVPEPAPEPVSIPNDPPGTIPQGFVIGSAESLARLDAHQSLVVIMMENRSYDHLLGGLATARPRAVNPYDGPPTASTNASAAGFMQTVPLVDARRIGMGTAIPVSPNHHYHESMSGHGHGAASSGSTSDQYHPVPFQMGDGTEETIGSGGMGGFARDLLRRTDSPQLAMTMYREADLPVYYKLADLFCTCDRWFCAHPGPTWPNRFATIMGSIPELDNFEIDDPRIGFLKYQNIFNTLTNHGIEWRVFESDLSLIRMFDRYRLDDQRVVPLYDKDDGLAATLLSPQPLPRVMFIEPNFADLPPVATANDDHPPADLAAGQAFIADVCDMIWAARRFDDCLVLITYDEHGGFYDHVPPPGTPKAEPSPAGLRSKLHPEGPDYLGPRVPTFILSPFVSSGLANKTIFDHTSILKTILVHNRERLPGSVLGSFGDRVNAAAHLGQVLDLSSPRSAPLPFDPMRRPQSPTGGSTSAGGPVSGGLATGAALDSAAAARPALPPRTVTVVPRPGEPGASSDAIEEPRDFHAALRRSLVARRGQFG